jgi:hypothetical protein
MKSFSRFSRLNLGVKRVLWVLAVLSSIIPLLISIIAAFDNWPHLEQTTETILILVLISIASLVGPFICFWLFVWLVLWIIEGFAQADHGDKQAGTGSKEG